MNEPSPEPTSTQRRQALLVGSLVVTLVGVAFFGPMMLLFPAAGGCAGMFVGWIGSVVGACVAASVVKRLGFPQLSQTQEGILAWWAGLQTAWFAIYCLFAGLGIKLGGGS